MKKFLLLFICLYGALQIGMAQDCDLKLRTAEEYYNRGEYRKAAKMYQQVVESCGATYGGASARLAECNRLVSQGDEEAAYNECRNSNDPNVLQSVYLDHFPNGRHAAEIRQRKATLLAQWAAANEERREYIAYTRCNTIRGCEEYLQNYPNGKYASEVRNKKYEMERGIRQREQYLRELEEAQPYAYMKDYRIVFGNAYDIQGQRMKDAFGSTLYAADMRFLVPKLIYNGRLSMERETALLYCVLFGPDGTLMHSFFNGMYVDPGQNNSVILAGYGNPDASVFSPGTYQFEVWYDGDILFSTSFNLEGKDYSLSSAGWRQALAKCLEIPTEIYEDDGLYKGCINAGQRSRLGIYYWNTSTCYFGNWNQGERNGWGILVVRDGYEVTNCPDCAYFVGQFRDGIKSGEGTCYDRAGNLIYYGQFADDRPVSNYPMSGYTNYKFICIDKGNGSFYLGEVENEQPEGKGIFMQRNGDLWLGDWTGGNRNGNVLYLPYDGMPVVERWSNGVRR